LPELPRLPKVIIENSTRQLDQSILAMMAILAINGGIGMKAFAGL
jgi:hypothetical protein